MVSGGGADDPCPELQAIFLTRRVTFVQSKGEESFTLTLTFTGYRVYGIGQSLVLCFGLWESGNKT
jgi:hypothetical protein